MIVQVVIGQAKSIEIPQSFNATVFTVFMRRSHQYIFPCVCVCVCVSCQRIAVKLSTKNILTKSHAT